MRPARFVAMLATLAVASVAAAAQPTAFNIAGTLTITADRTGAPTGTDAFAGTLDINTATGTVTGADITLGSPYTGLTIPTLDVIQTSETGGAGQYVYDIVVCAATDCSSNWLMNIDVQVSGYVPTLIGYAGGKITETGLFYGGPQSPWGGCPIVTSAGGCGLVTATSHSGGGSNPGVPEPGSAALMLLGLAATCLRRAARH
jgi:hypothetical protein